MTSPQTILHLDLDAFYASVEQLDRPELRGLPVIVGGDARRGVVCAASYEARKFGVRSAMPTAQAHRLCPRGVFLPPRFDRYAALSEQVMSIFGRFTPLVEPLSLDEAFLDVTASSALFGTGRDIATAIRKSVRAETGLAVSAGIAEVKFAAKIATDLGKPDGLMEVPRGGVREFLAPLPVGRLWGVGKVTEAALLRSGLALIGDVARADRERLERTFGSHGAHLHDLANGRDERVVIAHDEAKSVGAEETFEDDLLGAESLEPGLLAQSHRVARRLRAHGLRGHVVTLKVKYADFTLVTRRATLSEPADDAGILYRAVIDQLVRVDLTRPIRLTGVSVSGFDAQPSQLGLFAEPESDTQKKRRTLNAVLDSIAARYGEDAVQPAAIAGRRKR